MTAKLSLTAHLVEFYPCLRQLLIPLVQTRRLCSRLRRAISSSPFWCCISLPQVIPCTSLVVRGSYTCETSHTFICKVTLDRLSRSLLGTPRSYAILENTLLLNCVHLFPGSLLLDTRSLRQFKELKLKVLEKKAVTLASSKSVTFPASPSLVSQKIVHP